MARSKNTLASKVKANTERQKRGAMNASYLSLPEGIPLIQIKEKMTLVVDFLPYTVTSDHHMDKDVKLKMAVKGTEWWKLPFRTHKGIGPNRQAIVCPRSVSPKLRCPICEEYDAEREQGASHDDVGHLWPSLRNLYLVYPRMKGYPKVPHILDISQHLCQRFINDEMESQEEYDFMDVRQGKTVSLRFSERTHNNYKFYEVSRIDFLERKKAIPKSVLQKAAEIDLDNCLVVLSYDEILEIFHSTTPVEDPDTQPARRKSKKSKKSKKADNDVDWGEEDDDEEEFDEDVEDAIFDEDDEDEEEEDFDDDFDEEEDDEDEDEDDDDFDEEDEDEDEDDEDDDDFDEEDEEEEEEPKRSKKSKKSKKTKTSKKTSRKSGKKRRRK